MALYSSPGKSASLRRKFAPLVLNEPITNQFLLYMYTSFEKINIPFFEDFYKQVLDTASLKPQSQDQGFRYSSISCYTWKTAVART